MGQVGVGLRDREEGQPQRFSLVLLVDSEDHGWVKGVALVQSSVTSCHHQKAGQEVSPSYYNLQLPIGAPLPTVRFRNLPKPAQGQVSNHTSL